jgi:hypothetical protein
MSRRNLSFLAAMGLLVSDQALASPRLIPTNVPGVHAVEGPSGRFDPVAATAEQRRDLGFPPPPDAALHAQSYAHWARAMRASKTRLTPKLAMNPMRHGAMRRGVMSSGARLAAALAHSTADTSSNWSGSVLTNAATSFGANSFWLVGGDMTVPVASQPFNSCSGGWLYDSAWVGLDGALDYSDDVLQAGLDADAYCADGQTSTNYDVWYEWAPAYGAVVQNMTVQPGEQIYVAVWAVSATEGAAYIVDEDTGQSVSVIIDPPSGTQLIGNSAEFITERPEVNNKLGNLARYTVEYFNFGYVFDNNQVASFPALPTPPVQALQVTMLDNAGNPISYPEVLGGASIITTVEGSAQ